MNHSHHVVPRDGDSVTLYGVWSSDRVTGIGEDGRASGHECNLIVTLRARREHLDGDVVRVGFQGVDNGFPYFVDIPGGAGYRGDLWDLLFPLARYTNQPDAPAPAKHEVDAESVEADETDDLDPMMNVAHTYTGSFYVETSAGTYFWLKRRGETDFEFGYGQPNTLLALTSAV